MAHRTNAKCKKNYQYAAPIYLSMGDEKDHVFKISERFATDLNSLIYKAPVFTSAGIRL